MREDDIAIGPLKADQFQSDETLVDVDHFGHLTQPLLAVEQLEQLTNLETLVAGGAQGTQEIGGGSWLAVYRCNSIKNSVLITLDRLRDSVFPLEVSRGASSRNPGLGALSYTCLQQSTVNDGWAKN